MLIGKQKMRLEKRPRDTASATAGAGAEQGARSVRALEVLGGDDTDSDGDEAPRAEEEAADGEAGEEAAENVKAESAPALEPAVEREPSDSWRQQQQQPSRRACGRRSGARSGRGVAPVAQALAWRPGRLL